MRNRLISKLVRSTVVRSNVQGYVAPIRVQSSLARQQIDGSFAESERKFSTLPTDRAQQSVKQLKIFAEVNGKRSGINIADTEDVDALRKQIKKEFAPELDSYAAASLIVKTSAKSTEALNPEATLRDVLIDAQGKQLKYVYVELPLAPDVSHWWQIFEGKRDTLPWQADDKATAYFNELLSQEPQKIPIAGTNDEGESCIDGELHVIRLKSWLQADEKSTSFNLVVPQSTRDMWQVVINKTNKFQSDQRVLVVGSPGMGKSRSINYFIKALIAKRREATRPMPVIVFEHRKDNIVWLFAPNDPANKSTEYKAFSIVREKFISGECVALDNPDNYYVVDSSQAERAKMPSSSISAVTVYVCSPDFRHYSEYQKHMQGGFKIFCPAWRPQDIMAARTYMNNPVLSEEVAKTRMEVVGPIPRRVFGDDNTFLEFKKRIDTALNEHQGDIERVLITGSSALEPDSQHEQKPRSSVFMFGICEGDFQKSSVHFVSDYARNKISLNTLKKVLLDIHFRDPSRAVEFGKLFEKVCFALLDSGWRGTLKPITGFAKELNVKEAVDLKVCHPAKKGSGVTVVKGGDKLWERVYELMRDMELLPKSSPPIYFASNFPLFDAADAKNRGWNSTLAKGKSIKASTVEKVRSGLQLSDRELLHIVYLVPHGSRFKFSPQLPQAEKSQLSTLVSLFAMEIPGPDDSAWQNVVARA